MTSDDTSFINITFKIRYLLFYPFFVNSLSTRNILGVNDMTKQNRTTKKLQQ